VSPSSLILHLDENSVSWRKRPSRVIGCSRILLAVRSFRPLFRRRSRFPSMERTP